MVTDDEQAYVEEAVCWSSQYSGSVVHENDGGAVATTFQMPISTSSLSTANPESRSSDCFPSLPASGTVEDDVREVDSVAVIAWMRGEIARQHGLLDHRSRERASKDAMIGELRYQLARQELLLQHTSRQIVAVINRKEDSIAHIREFAVDEARLAVERLHQAALRLLAKYFQARLERSFRQAVSSWSLMSTQHGKEDAEAELVGAKQEGGLGMLRLIMRRMTHDALARYLSQWKESMLLWRREHNSAAKAAVSAVDLYEATREDEEEEPTTPTRRRTFVFRPKRSDLRSTHPNRFFASVSNPNSVLFHSTFQTGKFLWQ